MRNWMRYLGNPVDDLEDRQPEYGIWLSPDVARVAPTLLRVVYSCRCAGKSRRLSTGFPIVASPISSLRGLKSKVSRIG
jgi:hypothetical protein